MACLGGFPRENSLSLKRAWPHLGLQGCKPQDFWYALWTFETKVEMFGDKAPFWLYFLLNKIRHSV